MQRASVASMTIPNTSSEVQRAPVAKMTSEPYAKSSRSISYSAGSSSTMDIPPKPADQNCVVNKDTDVMVSDVINSDAIDSDIMDWVSNSLESGLNF